MMGSDISSFSLLLMIENLDFCDTRIKNCGDVS